MALNRLPVAIGVALLLALVLAQSALAAHPVYRGGSGSIPQTCGADLDNTLLPAFGCDTTSGPDDYDVNFIAHTSTNRVIQYNNHIFNKIVKMGATKPGYLACKNSALGFNEYKAKRNVGNWFCVLTSEGRYARLQITKVVAGGPMTIAYTTWCKQTDSC